MHPAGVLVIVTLAVLALAGAIRARTANTRNTWDKRTDERVTKTRRPDALGAESPVGTPDRPPDERP